MTKTTKPLGWTSRAWFNLPADVRKTHLEDKEDESTGGADARKGVDDPPPPPAPPRAVVIPPGAWLDKAQLYVITVLGHRYRAREDGTRMTKTTRPLGWTSAWFNLPADVRETHLGAGKFGTSDPPFQGGVRFKGIKFDRRLTL